jgi:hypothetical protein
MLDERNSRSHLPFPYFVSSLGAPMNHIVSLARLSAVALALTALPAAAQTPAGVAATQSLDFAAKPTPAPGRAWLGVRIQEVDEASAKLLNLGAPRGALLVVIDPSGPAKASGLMPGDVILKLDGKPVQDAHDLPRIVATVPVGREVEVSIMRDGKEQIRSITLGRLNEGDKQTAPPSSPSALPILPTNDTKRVATTSGTIDKILAAPCEQILDFYEAGAHRSGQDGLKYIQNGIGISKSDFGRPEASAMLNRVKDCTNNAPNPDIRRRFLYVIATLGSMFDARNGDLAGIESVERSRKEQKLAATLSERNAEIANEKLGVAKNNAKNIAEDIARLSSYEDLIIQQEKLSTIRSEINNLPADMRDDLLDELQIAQVPIDKKIAESLANFRVKLVDIKKLNSNEEKLHALSALTKDVGKVPGTDAEVLKSTIDSMRSSIRAEMEVASKASSSAEEEKLQAIQNDEKAKTEHQQEALRKIEDDNAPASCKKFAKQMIESGPIFDAKKEAMLPTLFAAGQTSEACGFINKVVGAATNLRDAAYTCSKDAEEKTSKDMLTLATYFNGFVEHWSRAANEARCPHDRW